MYANHSFKFPQNIYNLYFYRSIKGTDQIFCFFEKNRMSHQLALQLDFHNILSDNVQIHRFAIFQAKMNRPTKIVQIFHILSTDDGDRMTPKHFDFLLYFLKYNFKHEASVSALLY